MVDNFFNKDWKGSLETSMDYGCSRMLYSGGNLLDYVGYN